MAQRRSPGSKRRARQSGAAGPRARALNREDTKTPRNRRRRMMILTSCCRFFVLFRLIVALLIFVSWVASQTASIRFQNVARSAGIDFILENHPTAQKHSIETMPGGVAAFDYDGDGLTDIYVTNGAAIPSMEKDSAKFYNRLYRNDGGMKFTDVTEQASVRGADRKSDV